MTAAQLKLFSWSLVGLFGTGLCLYVGSFIAQKQMVYRRVDEDEMRRVLSNVKEPPQKAEDIVSYNEVLRSLNNFNWTGKKKERPVATEEPGDPTPPPPPSVSTLLKVLLIKADPIDDSGSSCVIKYLPNARATTKDPQIVKHVGETLDPPNETVRIATITPDGVEFAFADESRAHETLQPAEFSWKDRVSSIGPGSIPDFKPKAFPRAPGGDYWPERTQQVRANEWWIGPEDAAHWEENYPEEIAKLRSERHRDPTTGKYDGIELREVPPDSLAAQHGAQEGDIIKSINGHAVTSQQEAINFAKNNAHKYDVWVIVIENKGLTRTVTYKTPKKK